MELNQPSVIAYDDNDEVEESDKKTMNKVKIPPSGRELDTIDKQYEEGRKWNAKKEKKEKKGHGVLIYFNLNTVEMMDRICSTQDMSRTTFIRQAVQRALLRWKSPFDNPDIWPPCKCGKRHNPSIHGRNEY